MRVTSDDFENAADELRAAAHAYGFDASHPLAVLEHAARTTAEPYGYAVERPDGGILGAFNAQENAAALARLAGEFPLTEDADESDEDQWAPAHVVPVYARPAEPDGYTVDRLSGGNIRIDADNGLSVLIGRDGDDVLCVHVNTERASGGDVYGDDSHEHVRLNVGLNDGTLYLDTGRGPEAPADLIRNRPAGPAGYVVDTSGGELLFALRDDAEEYREVARLDHVEVEAAYPIEHDAAVDMIAEERASWGDNRPTPAGVHWDGWSGSPIERADELGDTEHPIDDMAAALIVAERCGLPFVAYVNERDHHWHVSAFGTDNEAAEAIEDLGEGSFWFDSRTHYPVEAPTGRPGYSYPLPIDVTRPNVDSVPAVRAWFIALHWAGVNYHPEETFAEIVSADGPLFSTEEAARMDAAMERARSVVGDVCELAVDVMRTAEAHQGADDAHPASQTSTEEA